jgi:acyl-CoA reductase-like NAD-dependent aldehyde dehydrogenase
VQILLSEQDAIAAEITAEMGRPIRYTPGEVRGFAERATTMARLAPSALAPIVLASGDTGIHRRIERVPVGVVVVLAAWNYPYLVAVNSVVPALLAGNAVLLKHSDQTPSCPERIASAFRRAGLPDGVLQTHHMTHALVRQMIRDPRVDRVAFTGSVAGGRAVHEALGGLFTPVGLELGGNDAAYVRRDADPVAAAASLVDGALFNSGQSCCGIERIYLHADVAEPFLEAACAEALQHILGDPRDPATTLGPVVRAEAAARIRGVVAAAIASGGRGLIDAAAFPADQEGSSFVAPQIVVGAPAQSELMQEETFGPVAGVQIVGSDDEALSAMNDSPYGLTGSIWTRDRDAAEAIGRELEVGTVFMNRCDYLDPELAWVGVKNSGVGCTLSRVGFESLTRPKSFHFREA